MIVCAASSHRNSASPAAHGSCKGLLATMPAPATTPPAHSVLHTRLLGTRQHREGESPGEKQTATHPPPHQAPRARRGSSKHKPSSHRSPARRHGHEEHTLRLSLVLRLLFGKRRTGACRWQVGMSGGSRSNQAAGTRLPRTAPASPQCPRGEGGEGSARGARAVPGTRWAPRLPALCAGRTAPGAPAAPCSPPPAPHRR